MINPQSKLIRILAIAPSTRGFGFAVLEGETSLVDWGGKAVKGDKNKECLAKVDEMMALYRPTVLVLENYAHKSSRRSARVRKLGARLAALAARRKVRVKLFSNDQVRRGFFAEGEGTKHELAEMLAQRFHKELGPRLPPRRKAWMNPDARMAIFEAVALALTHGLSVARGHCVEGLVAGPTGEDEL